jgi:type VI secretion system protein ImpJ
MNHLASLPGLHPERFYEIAVSLAGELATYVSQRRRPASFIGYRHDDLRGSYEEVLEAIRLGLTDMPMPEANEIPLTSPAANVWVGTIPSVDMLKHCEFILAVSASVATEELAAIYAKLVTVAAQERLRDLVVNKVPGIPLNRLPMAPMSIPVHGSSLYFQLERQDDNFRRIANALALHINYDLRRLPELRMTLWAVPDRG